MLGKQDVAQVGAVKDFLIYKTGSNRRLEKSA